MGALRLLPMLPAALLTLALLLPAPALAQTEPRRPDAAVGRVAALGSVSESEQRFIHTSLQAGLSRSYTVVSQQEYDRAEELAFAELSAGQCTEDQCIRKIQEILQVDRLFVLQVIREGEYTQVSLTLARGAERIVRARRCRACDIGRLDDAVAGLVQEVRDADLGGLPAGAVSAAAPLQPPPEPPRETAPAPPEAEQEPFEVTWVVGVGLGGHTFSKDDQLRAAPAGSTNTISNGTVIQAYGEYYLLGRLGVGARIYGFNATRDSSGGTTLTETVNVSTVLVTGHFLTAERPVMLFSRRWGLRYGLLGGVGSASYSYSIANSQTTAKLSEELTTGSALLLGGFVDWGGRAFGLRLNLNLLRTVFNEKLADRYEVDGSGGGLVLDAR
ncbi:MAG TPA: hypothetical protein VGC20_08500, partial [bacterium]